MSVTVPVVAADGAKSFVVFPDPVVVASGGGGYDNIAAVPGAANRPVFSNGVLSWKGPAAGGPSTSNDSAQTLALTNSGSVTTSAAGQVIEGLNVTGQINVNHSNCTIRRNHVRASSTNNGDAYQVWVANGVTGTIVEDCELDGNSTSGSVGGNGNISGPGFSVNSATVRRNNLHNSEQCIRYQLNNVLFVDNWCHHVMGVDCDMFECYPVGADAKNNVIRHNCFDGAGQVNLNSAINFTNGWSGMPGNVGPNTVDGNYFVNAGTYFAVCDDNGQGSGAVTWTATNNGFYITNGGRPRRDDTTVTANSGNFVMATPTSTSGALIGGSGAI